MRKRLILTVLIVFITSCLNISFAAEKKQGPKGPAPSSGDGIPDGSGF